MSLNSLQGIPQMASHRINQLNEKAVGVLMALLVVDVWVGVMDRYWFHWQLGWVEELARYIMIWAILLAVPCSVHHREHIGLVLLANKFPPKVRRMANIIIDLIGLAFFGYMTFAGQTFVEKGVRQFSTVFDMPMSIPYAAIPAAFGLAAIQTLLVLFRDLGKPWADEQTITEEDR